MMGLINKEVGQLPPALCFIKILRQREALFFFKGANFSAVSEFKEGRTSVVIFIVTFSARLF